MKQKQYFELFNGEVIPDKEVEIYIFSFKSFMKRKNKFEKSKSTQDVNEEHPLGIYFDAFHKLCRDEKAQVMLNESNWGENEELRKFFQQKVNSIEAESNRDPLYAMLRENIHKLSKEGKIYYRPASQLTNKNKEGKFGVFSFNPLLDSKEFDDISLEFLKNSPLDLNDPFQKCTTNIKIVEALARMTWEHIYNHHENIQNNVKSPWITIRTLKAYIQDCCSDENLIRLFGKRLEDGHASLDAPMGDGTATQAYFLTSDRGTTEDMEKCTRITTNMTELAQNFLTTHKKYALTICISYVCKKTSPTVIDNILNEHRKADTQLKTIYKKTETFLLKNSLHPNCIDYEKEQVFVFFNSLHRPCHESILPEGCPQCAAVCAEESDYYPCTNLS